MFSSNSTGIFALSLALASAVAAGPIVKREGINDAVILNYALTLEHLEDTFYREGLAKYTEQDFASAGFDAVFYNNIKEVSKDETEHVSFLTTALKGMHCVSLSHTVQCPLSYLVAAILTFFCFPQPLELSPSRHAHTTLATPTSRPSSPRPPSSRASASQHTSAPRPTL